MEFFLDELAEVEPAKVAPELKASIRCETPPRGRRVARNFSSSSRQEYLFSSPPRVSSCEKPLARRVPGLGLIFPSVGMLDEVKVEAADPLVEDKVVDEEPGETGRAGGGGGGGEVAVGVAPREEGGSGDGLAAGTVAGFRST